jgi:type I site-specific restriction endonuclease
LGSEEAQTLNKLKIETFLRLFRRNTNGLGYLNLWLTEVETASFLTLNPRAFCFNEQGTGKTASAIWAADYLMEINCIYRVLIICPLSIMQSAWQADLFKFAMHRKVAVAYGDRLKRKAVIDGDAQFVIINYDGVEIVADDIARNNFDLVIIDEANAYKTITTQRWKTLNHILTPRTWLWMMTGTPAAQSPTDAFGLSFRCACPTMHLDSLVRLEIRQ